MARMKTSEFLKNSEVWDYGGEVCGGRKRKWKEERRKEACEGKSACEDKVPEGEKALEGKDCRESQTRRQKTKGEGENKVPEGEEEVKLSPESDMNSNWQDYISVDPKIYHGEPCIKGTHVPVSVIVESVKSGMTPDEIIASYPQLSKEAIEAALSYDSDMVWERLMKLRDKMGKHWHSEKSAVEILSEMRR